MEAIFHQQICRGGYRFDRIFLFPSGVALPTLWPYLSKANLAPFPFDYLNRPTLPLPFVTTVAFHWILDNLSGKVREFCWKSMCFAMDVEYWYPQRPGMTIDALRYFVALAGSYGNCLNKKMNGGKGHQIGLGPRAYVLITLYVSHWIIIYFNNCRCGRG